MLTALRSPQTSPRGHARCSGAANPRTSACRHGTAWLSTANPGTAMQQQHARSCPATPPLQTFIWCCKPSHSHTPALQILAHSCTSTTNPGTATRQHCKPTHTHAAALQTLAQPRTSTANPHATTHHHCKPSLPAALTLQTLFLPAPLLQSLAQLHADTASPHPSAWAHRTPSHTRAGGAVRPCAPVLAAAGPGSWPRVTADPPEPACPPRRAAASGGPGNN